MMEFAVADVQPLFQLLPLSHAMPTLLVKQPISGQAYDFVEGLQAPPAVKAALWIYVDDLESAHAIVQDLHTPTGAFLHAIVHRREGDFWNSKYWFRQAGRHPVIEAVEHYEPTDLVDRASEAGGTDEDDLLELQRREWQGIFEHAVSENR